MSDLLMFYGTECKFCHKMDPLVEKLEKELKVKVEKIEVWHNTKNAKLLHEKDNIGCGGVPFFFNKKSGKAICGAVSYSVFKKWAMGK